MKIAVYDGAQWVASEDTASAVFSRHVPFIARAYYTPVTHPDEADGILFVYSASDHISYVRFLLERYKRAVFIVRTGENLHRKIRMPANYISIKATNNKKLRRFFDVLYPVAAALPCLNFIPDKGLYRLLLRYAPTRNIYILLCQTPPANLTRRAIKNHTSVCKNFNIFSHNLYSDYKADASAIPNRLHSFDIHTRARFCCTVFSNTTPERIAICKMLSRIGAVDVLGRNPIASGTPESVTAFSSLKELYSRYRFAICFENSVQSGYITEKLYNVISGGAIPIYLGPADFASYVNPKCAIHATGSRASLVKVYRTVARLESDREALHYIGGMHHFTDAQRATFAREWAECSTMINGVFGVSKN